VVAEVGPQDGQGLHPPWGGGLLHGPAGHPGGRANLTSPRLASPFPHAEAIGGGGGGD
jgi:hypothetical protein